MPERIESNLTRDFNISKICCIGAGYVGGPTCAVIALKCPHIQVVVVDKDSEKIESWNSNQLPFYENGLHDIVERCRGKNLHFSTDIERAIIDADLIFVSVNTPTKSFGEGMSKCADLTYVEQAARTIASCCDSNSPATTIKIIVEKSTVPVKSAESIEKILKANVRGSCPISFTVLSNPEFLAEGSAIDNLLNPDRILIGGENSPLGKIGIGALSDVYMNWVSKEKILTMDTWSSELSKLACNAFLAQRISSINALSVLCEASGADVGNVAKAIGTDHRLGDKFLKASVGFGGSCFQKDILNLVYICESLNLPLVADYWNQIVKINDHQKHRFTQLIISKMFNTVSEKIISVLGFTFKKDTSDCRESPAIDVVRRLLEEKAHVHIYDPKASEHNIMKSLSENRDKSEKNCTATTINLNVMSDVYECCKDSHAIVICTEWDLFSTLNFNAIFERMAKPAFLFDGRRVVDGQKLRDIGFQVYILGSSGC